MNLRKVESCFASTCQVQNAVSFKIAPGPESRDCVCSVGRALVSKAPVMALSSATASLSSTRSGFRNNELLTSSSNSRCRRSRPACPSIFAVSCSLHSRKLKVDEAEAVQGGRRAALAALAGAGAFLVTTLRTKAAEAAMQKVEGTRRDTQDAVTRGLREPSQLSSGKGNSIKEAARINTQASGGTILGAPRFEEPGGAYRSPQSQTEKSFDKRSTPAGILQNRANN